jgi:hypothetical protein
MEKATDDDRGFGGGDRLAGEFARKCWWENVEGIADALIKRRTLTYQESQTSQISKQRLFGVGTNLSNKLIRGWWAEKDWLRVATPDFARKARCGSNWRSHPSRLTPKL